MIDPRRMLDDLLGVRVPGSGGTVRDAAGRAEEMARENPVLAGGLAAVLLGTRAGRELTGTAVKVGGLALVGGLAWQAWQNYRAGVQPGEGAPPQLAPPPGDSAFDPAIAPQGEDAFAMALLRAMIGAAKSDGHVDKEERGRITQRLNLAGFGGDAEQFLLDELARPVDIDGLVAAAQSDAQKVELYTAARLAVDPDQRSERGFLDMLAGRLGLPDALVDHVEATVATARG